MNVGCTDAQKTKYHYLNNLEFLGLHQGLQVGDAGPDEVVTPVHVPVKHLKPQGAAPVTKTELGAVQGHRRPVRASIILFKEIQIIIIKRRSFKHLDPLRTVDKSSRLILISSVQTIEGVTLTK